MSGCSGPFGKELSFGQKVDKLLESYQNDGRIDNAERKSLSDEGVIAATTQYDPASWQAEWVEKYAPQLDSHWYSIDLSEKDQEKLVRLLGYIYEDPDVAYAAANAKYIDLSPQYTKDNPHPVYTLIHKKVKEAATDFLGNIKWGRFSTPVLESIGQYLFPKFARYNYQVPEASDLIKTFFDFSGKRSKTSEGLLRTAAELDGNYQNFGLEQTDFKAYQKYLIDHPYLFTRSSFYKLLTEFAPDHRQATFNQESWNRLYPFIQQLIDEEGCGANRHDLLRSIAAYFVEHSKEYVGPSLKSIETVQPKSSPYNYEYKIQNLPAGTNIDLILPKGLLCDRSKVVPFELLQILQTVFKDLDLKMKDVEKFEIKPSEHLKVASLNPLEEVNWIITFKENSESFKKIYGVTISKTYSQDAVKAVVENQVYFSRLIISFNKPASKDQESSISQKGDAEIIRSDPNAARKEYRY